MGMISYELKPGAELGAEELQALEEAKNTPILYDEDCPELTPAMEKAFLLAAKSRNRYLGKAV